MANLKSSKKDAKRSKITSVRNAARLSEIKTATKKLVDALAANDVDTAKKLLVLAESKLARAEGKGVLKKNTAGRKISRLAKKVSAATR